VRIEKKVPKSWLNEIATESKKHSFKTLEIYGPLALLLFTRIERMSKESEMSDLCMMNASNDGLKFIQRVLSFFNFNFKLSLKSEKSKLKIDRLMATIPPIKELKFAIRHSEMTEKELLIFKVVLDILEAYLK